MDARGADLAYGRKLPRLLREAGLTDVRADAYFPVRDAGRAAQLEVATLEMISGQLVSAGIASVEEIEAHISNVRAGRLDLAQPPMISAWGRAATSEVTLADDDSRLAPDPAAGGRLQRPPFALAPPGAPERRSNGCRPTGLSRRTVPPR